MPSHVQRRSYYQQELNWSRGFKGESLALKLLRSILHENRECLFWGIVKRGEISLQSDFIVTITVLGRTHRCTVCNVLQHDMICVTDWLFAVVAWISLDLCRDIEKMGPFSLGSLSLTFARLPRPLKRCFVRCLARNDETRILRATWYCIGSLELVPTLNNVYGCHSGARCTASIVIGWRPQSTNGIRLRTYASCIW